MAKPVIATKFRIPKRDKNGPTVSPDWERSGYTDEDLTFWLRVLDLDQEERAHNAAGAGQNFMASFNEMVAQSIVRVGGRRVLGRRDETRAWLKALGRGRKYVEAAFNSISSVSEADVNSFLEGAQTEEA